MKIEEFSKKCGLKKDTLRYYEKIGLLKKVKRDKAGQRNYQEEDIKQVYFIKCMIRTGLKLSEVSNYMDLYDKGSSTFDERLNILYKQKEETLKQMKELDETLKYLDDKINIYTSNK